jgi:phosphonatase-like hydrolase
MSVDLVVFDMTGTTVSCGEAVHTCLAAALGTSRVRASLAEINAVMGLPKPLAIRRLVEADVPGAEASDRLVDSIHEEFARLVLHRFRDEEVVREAAGAGETVRELRARGIKVALDTGFRRAVVDAVLERLGWEGLFDATVADDEVPNGRPHPDMVWRAMKLTGVAEPGRVAKVGDTPADLEEGWVAGCGLIVGITGGSHTAQELAAWPHTHLIPDVTASSRPRVVVGRHGIGPRRQAVLEMSQQRL